MFPQGSEARFLPCQSIRRRPLSIPAARPASGWSSKDAGESLSCSRALAFARARRKESLAELMDFVRFPTVSSQPKHAGDIMSCANWLAGHLRRIGLDDVEIIPTKRHPLVSASRHSA